MICQARSGGTLLNQCLGALKNVVMLSEVNPLGGGWGLAGPDSLTTVKSQAAGWYNINLKSDDYLQSVLELVKHCETSQKQLVIRDWTHVNFFDHPTILEKPSNTLLNYELLKKNIDVSAFAFLRNPIDIWTSRGRPKPVPFFKQYLKYVNELEKHDIQIFKYEDFCAHPELTFRNICSFLDLPYSSTINSYQTNIRVNGDIRNPKGKPSRGRIDKGICVLPSIPIPEKFLHQIRNDQSLESINNLLDYGY